MENVVLVVHMLLALALVGVVLLQRSEGGGLGIGGGGGGGGVMSGRSAATALGKVTWLLAIAFICTSIALTVMSARNSSGSSVVDFGAPFAAPGEGDIPTDGQLLLPPSATGADDGALLPSSD